MVDTENIHKISQMGHTTPLPVITDGADFPHTGLIKALNQMSSGNIVVKTGADFDINQTGGNIIVDAGKILRNGMYHSVNAKTFADTDLSNAHDKGYHLLVVADGREVGETVNNLYLRTPTAPNVVADFKLGDTIVAMIEYSSTTSADNRLLQFFTTNKEENGLSIAYANSNVYTEVGSITGTSDGLFIDGIGTVAPAADGSDKVIIQDSSASNVIKSVTVAQINALAPQGDITGITAGAGLTGTDLTGPVPTLNVEVDDSTIEINSDALRVKDDGITYAKIQNVVNDERVLGRVSGANGVIEELTQTQVLTFLGDPLQDADFTSNGFMKRSSLGNYTVDANTYLTAEADTLDTVTGRGATTANILNLNGVVNFGSTITHDKNAAPNNAATINPTITATMNYLNDVSGVATLPDPNVYVDTVITIKNVHANTMTITPPVGTTIDNGLINHDKRVTVTNTIKLLQGESITLQAIADGGIVGDGSIAQGWYIADTDTNFSGADAISAVEGEATLALSGSVTVATGQTFRTPRLATVSVSAGTGLTEATHAGAYLICAGNVTLPTTSSNGEHYTILNTTGGDITVTATNSTTINGGSANTVITVATFNAVTCIGIGSNNWIALGV